MVLSQTQPRNQTRWPELAGEEKKGRVRPLKIKILELDTAYKRSIFNIFKEIKRIEIMSKGQETRYSMRGFNNILHKTEY